MAAAQRTVLVLLAVFLLHASAWDVDISQDGTVQIQFPLKVSGKRPVITSKVRGLTSHSEGRDCSSGRTFCKQWDTHVVRVHTRDDCVTSETQTVEPVGPGISVSTGINLTGHLYGGPEQFRQYWPLDDFYFNDYSLVTKQEDYQGIADGYWLSSLGYFIHVHPESSLFLSQNNHYDDKLTFTSENKAPYPHPALLIHNLTVCISNDARQAHQLGIEKYLKKPTGIPDERMVRKPIWSTWARYKKDINEEVVLRFADEIVEHGFDNSQLEIDDLWETCYGSLTFDTNKFPDMKGLSEKLKAKGFRVTLWIHPFINTDCNPYYSEAVKKGYLVKNTDGETESTWWNGKGGVIDFTNPEAVSWWTARVKAVAEENGIDSLKFDAGETSWLPQLPVLSGAIHLQPNLYTRKYVEAVAQFGDMIEVRSAHFSQHLPIFIRMQDKDSRWDFVNGLPTLITSLLQMNMVGYPLVLPDMVGGNGYAEAPSKELFIRWLQANVFMPAIQYSYVPWDFDQETVDIALKYTKLHEEYSQKIIETLNKAVEEGTPVNPPVWWIAPQDTEAQVIADEFLLGEDILVAPVIKEGANERDIYLPQGTWKHGLRPDWPEVQGPVWLRNYTATLSDLPFFIRV